MSTEASEQWEVQNCNKRPSWKWKLWWKK